MVVTLPEAGPVTGAARSRAKVSLGHRARRNVSAHGFLIGAVLCFAFFSWYPMCREIIMSFEKTRLAPGLRPFYPLLCVRAGRNGLASRPADVCADAYSRQSDHKLSIIAFWTWSR